MRWIHLQSAASFFSNSSSFGIFLWGQTEGLGAHVLPPPLSPLLLRLLQYFKLSLTLCLSDALSLGMPLSSSLFLLPPSGVARVVHPKYFLLQKKEKKNSKKKLQKSRDASTRTQQKRERERSEFCCLLSLKRFLPSFLLLDYI